MVAPGPPRVRWVTGGVIRGGSEPLTGVEDACHPGGAGASDTECQAGPLLEALFWDLPTTTTTTTDSNHPNVSLAASAINPAFARRRARTIWFMLMRASPAKVVKEAKVEPKGSEFSRFDTGTN